MKYFKSVAVKRIQQRFDGVTEEEIFWVLTVPAAWKTPNAMLYRDLAIAVCIHKRNVICTCM